MLQREVLDAQFAGMKQALAGNDPEAMQRVRDMLADLNQLLAAHARGEDTTEQFDEFMDKHGEFFPEKPVERRRADRLAGPRQAAAERMMRSLSREQRDELAELMEQALGDVDLQSQLAQLQDNLSALRPGMMRGGPVDIDGDEPLGYGDAVGAGRRAGRPRGARAAAGPGLPRRDPRRRRRRGARAPASRPATWPTSRRCASWSASSSARGTCAATPTASRSRPRRCAGSARAPCAGSSPSWTPQARGDHDDQRSGAADERTGAFLPWRFGDERPIDAVRTVQNAVLRRAAHQADDETPARLDVDDFAVAETERRTTAAVALCVDLSFSMVQEGRWGPMKQTALALSHLIATRFRNDALEIIGFDRTARRLTPLELAEVEPEWVQGTNLQHALMLAGRHLRRHPDAEPVVLVVTDGEPTAHLDVDGYPLFHWPPTDETVRATVGEVDAMTRLGATLNFFLLGDDPGLARFVDAVARRNGGRVFTPEIDRLGEYVVADYLRSGGGRSGGCTAGTLATA